MNENEHDVATNPLDAVATAGAARLRAEAAEDANAARHAHEELMRATGAAMQAGVPLRDITAAERRGHNGVRMELRSDTLRKVERGRRQMRDAERGYHTAIARVLRLGLSTREIAHPADVTHGTIRAITVRLAGGDNGSAPVPADESDSGIAV